MPRLPPFDRTWPANRTDVLLLLNSHVHQTASAAVLGEIAAVLAELGYQVVDLDASSWQSERSMHDSLSSALRFPDYCGKNLDALNDAMRGVALYEHGSDPGATGTALVLRGFETFAAHVEHAAQALLGIVAEQARAALLVDHPMLCIVQTSDDRWFKPVGGTPVMHMYRIPRQET